MWNNFSLAWACGLILHLSPALLLASSVEAVDTRDRAAVIRLFQNSYLAFQGVPMGWNGVTSDCFSGTNHSDYAKATLRRVNFFRAMAGLPGNVTIREDWSSGCQDAALMMSVERRVSHEPDAAWRCYTKNGADAAARSNLYLGRSGPEAIDGYMDDFGAGNHFVGHRRWVLYPPLKEAGSGSVQAQSGGLAANCLRVIGGGGARPPQPEWVAWPPAGHVPYQILPRISQRWSFSLPGADFRAATVEMFHAGTNVPARIEPLFNDRGFGDNTLVWVPAGVPFAPPNEDIHYGVLIRNVRLGGEDRSFEYTVTIINPNEALADRPPRILEGPNPLAVDLGVPAVFRVIAEGPGTLRYQWRFQGEPIPNATMSSLTIDQPTVRHAGDYDVIVSNAAGAVTSQAARLEVASVPLFSNIARESGVILIEWTGKGVLQEAFSLSGPWADLPGATSPFSTTDAGASRFFRLKLNLQP